MRRISILAVLLAVISVTQVSAQVRVGFRTQARLATQQAQGAIALSFEKAANSVPTSGSGNQGMLQLGSVAYSGLRQKSGVELERRSQSLVVRTWFSLHLYSFGQSLGSARLSAFLLQPDINHVYAIDGVKLTTLPQQIADQLRYGTVTQHRLEIEIPRSVPEEKAQVVQAIGFLAVPN